MNVLERAIQYRTVFESDCLPIWKPDVNKGHTGKECMVKWAAEQIGLQTRSEILRLFTISGNRVKDCNIGMRVRGNHGTVSFDIDSDRMRAWADKHLPPTPLVFSTGRGEQRIYKNPRVDTGSKRLDGGDYKASGYIIVPESIHQLFGKQYRWREEPTKELFAQTPVFPLEKLPRETHFGPRKPILPSKVDPIERAAAFIASYRRAGVSQDGHNTCYGLACRLVHPFPDGFGIPVDQAVALMYGSVWNQECEQPWTLKELRKKCCDAHEKIGSQRGRNQRTLGG